MPPAWSTMWDTGIPDGVPLHGDPLMGDDRVRNVSNQSLRGTTPEEAR